MGFPEAQNRIVGLSPNKLTTHELKDKKKKKIMDIPQDISVNTSQACS